ncbi:MAG: YfiR family protein [Gammaproteobacteria bacterium]|nr:YfiR family protein [Gammaproteobacteria bacterium]
MALLSFTKRCLIAPAIVLCLVCLMGGNSNRLKVTEIQIKAVFLYNFASFIRIPARAFRTENASIEYCVAEDQQMAMILESVVKGEVVQGHRLAVKHIDSPDQVPGCHVLYIGMHDSIGVERYLQMTAKQDTLTVSDDALFVKRGGMVSLLRKGRRIYPLINMDEVQQSKISLSAKLLALATLVGTQDE